MNTLPLIVGLLGWSGPASTARLTAVFTAFGVFAVEMQAVTWSGIGSLRILAAVNLVIAIALLLFRRPLLASFAPSPPRVVAWRHAVPLPALVALAAVVVLLNVTRPVQAADQYHLDKIDRIQQSGTLAYAPDADPKVNIVSSTYELVVADLGEIPIGGPVLVRLHGVLGLALYVLAIAAVRELLDAEGGWPWAVMLAVPVLFHQLVLIKNDLFVAIPVLVALTWALARARAAPSREILWATWLAGFAVAVKLTMFPVWLVIAATIVLRRRDRRQAALATAWGSALGVVSGGLVFMLIENAIVYGNVLPTSGIGDRNGTAIAVLTSIGRFAISLFDLGVITRVVWPARGGWGGTFGLPLIWAAIVLVRRSRDSLEAREALVYGGVCFLLFAAAFPDADLAQRLVLGPGLLLIAVAVHLLATGNRRGLLRLALPVVGLLSAAQIARSALLYYRQ